MTRKDAALDTSVLIDCFGDDFSIEDKFAELAILFVPIPVIAEMEFGYPKLKTPYPGKQRFDAFLAREDVKLIDCDRKVAEHFAEIRRHPRKTGTMIPINDIWIAACCIARGKTLMTRDTDFNRSPRPCRRDVVNRYSFLP